MLNNFDRIAQLPGTTHVFCGHEYTRANYAWAALVEQDNQRLQARKTWADATEVTIPSTIEEERASNLFMRSREPSLQALFKSTDPVIIMGTLRDMKNKNITVYND